MPDDSKYTTNINIHAPMEPMNATALYTPDKCEVWCGTQNGEAAFAATLEASGLPAEKCEVHKLMLGGGFGRRGMTDYVRQAVNIAKQMPGTPVKLKINTPTINATGLASVTVTGATPTATIELQGYSQNHYGTASFDNDPTPVDRVATADDSGVASVDDLRPASNTRLRARVAGCPDATAGSTAVITVRTQLTLAASRIGSRVYAFSGKSIPARPGGLVVGIGLNVTTARDELPHDGATSLRLEGGVTTDRDTLLRAILRELTMVLADVDAARTAYRELCSTVGQSVRVELPTGSVEGPAERIDDDGRLVVGGTPYGAGDVVHLRPLRA